ncbi:MAG: glycerate kinase [Syntrophaceae bacterium]|nr:glycerate kinase [Syntrophaceae bacterium]
MTSRELILDIFNHALEKVFPENLIAQGVSRKGDDLQIQENSYPLPPAGHVHVCGSGKASARMAVALEPVLMDRLAGGVVITNEEGYQSTKLTFLTGSHPVPTEKSLRTAEALMNYLHQLTDQDLCIYLLSGGSSALVENPLPPVSLAEFQAMSSLLLKSGMRIGEMNTVRKHLSAVKGGRLGALCPARIIVLVISDVIGDDLETIGSAPLYKDLTTYGDARSLIERYDLWRQVPDSVRFVIEEGCAGKITETVKKAPERIRHHLLGSNTVFLEAGRKRAEELGLPAHIMTSSLYGEAGEVAKVLIALAREIGRPGNPFSPPVCLLFGGETTVTVRGDGQGGRNQQLCLAALAESGFPAHCTLLSAGSDGIDGNSDAAGAIVDRNTWIKMNELDLNPVLYLQQNDAYHFFQQTGDLILTGPTGTNVMDMQILYVEG